MSFDAATALTPRSDGAFDAAVADGWSTPRGPLGGYVMAIVLAAMQETVGDPGRPVRSLTVHFLRPPAVGPVVVRPVLERAGRSLSTLTARLEQEGKLLALALGAFSAAWPGPHLDDAPMPEVEPAGERVPVGALPSGDRPSFTDRLTMQPRFGDPPFSGSDHAEVGGWLALLDERPVDALTVCVLADAWFPAPWPRLHALAPAPTIDLTVHFRAPLPRPDEPLLGRFRTTLVRDGFFEEDGELWAPDGSLVAQSRQLGLLIGAPAD